MPLLMKEADERVAYLTLNRPDRRNALNKELCEQLCSQLVKCAEDESVKVIVIRGAGTAFCGGADVTEMRASSSQADIVAYAERNAHLLKLAPSLRVPVLAALNGPAVGAGAALALACDGIVMAEHATLSFPEIHHGIAPLLVWPSLERHVGRLAAFEILTGDGPITAYQALERRWVNRVVKSEDLQTEVRAWALKIAALSSSALSGMKRIAFASDGCSLEGSLLKAVDAYKNQ
ncbi:short chain enoyl-CoA hydratase [Caballeronia choica]|jgi:enoyl-CoA hydratase|uniref:Short chain enoyl-CoA hydratase n=2 Tax=Caballeronia choica TaxID=326476 RepID=A0A158K795_9BURK|nr:short chain enoyl-CoA hydratase [Caballeronia choica]